MKKFRVILLILIAVMVITGCSKQKENESNPQPPTEQSESNTQSLLMNNSSQSESSTENNRGEWNIVNLPFEQASSDVQNIFHESMKNPQVVEELIPLYFLGYREDNGSDYAFFAQNGQNDKFYIYVHTNTEKVIEKIEISKPNSTLEILPTENFITIDNNEENTEETLSEEGPASKDDEESDENSLSESTQTSSSTSTPSDSSSSSSSLTSSSNSTVSQMENTEPPEVKYTIEEGLIKRYGSNEEAVKQYNSENSGLSLTISENTFTYVYRYPIVISPDNLPKIQEDIINTYKTQENNYIEIIKNIERDAYNTADLEYIIEYIDKDDNKVLTVQLNNQGLIDSQ